MFAAMKTFLVLSALLLVTNSRPTTWCDEPGHGDTTVTVTVTAPGDGNTHHHSATTTPNGPGATVTVTVGIPVTSAVPTTTHAHPTTTVTVTHTTSPAYSHVPSSSVAATGVTPSGPASTGTSGSGTNNTCTTGPVQCCDTVQPANQVSNAKLLGLLPLNVQGLDVPIGLTCTPLSVLGLSSGGTCSSQTVCCENNSFNGLIAIGCTPINIGL